MQEIKRQQTLADRQLFATSIETQAIENDTVSKQQLLEETAKRGRDLAKLMQGQQQACSLLRNASFYQVD